MKSKAAIRQERHVKKLDAIADELTNGKYKTWSTFSTAVKNGLKIKVVDDDR